MTMGEVFAGIKIMDWLQTQSPGFVLEIVSIYFLWKLWHRSETTDAKLLQMKQKNISCFMSIKKDMEKHSENIKKLERKEFQTPK